MIAKPTATFYLGTSQPEDIGNLEDRMTTVIEPIDYSQNPEKRRQQIQQEIDEIRDEKKSFATRGQPNHNCKALIQALKRDGYEIAIVFHSVDDPRHIMERARAAGRQADYDTVKSQFYDALRTLPEIAQLADKVTVIDVSQTRPNPLLVVNGYAIGEAEKIPLPIKGTADQIAGERRAEAFVNQNPEEILARSRDPVLRRAAEKFQQAKAQIERLMPGQQHRVGYREMIDRGIKEIAKRLRNGDRFEPNTPKPTKTPSRSRSPDRGRDR